MKNPVAQCQLCFERGLLSQIKAPARTVSFDTVKL